MADRFPLIVNATSRKIEEISSGDKLDLSGNGIVINGDNGNGKYLKSDGATVHWDNPGDVYLTQAQTLTNKTLEACIISGSNNTLTNIPNTALVNSGITINGATIALGGTVTTPDNNTTYTISAQDGSSASQKIIRLTSGGNFGSGIDDDVIFAVGSPSSIPSGSNALSLFLNRTDDTITLFGHVVDNNTITTLVAPGGSAQSGAINFTSSGAATVTMTGSTINVSALDTDTKTKIRVGSGGSYGPADNNTGNFTFLQGGATTITQGVNGTTGDPEITVSSLNTVTRVRGGTTSSFIPTSSAGGDITFAGGSSGNVTVTQSGNSILIDSVDTNTVTQLAANTEALASGNFRLKASGDASLTTATVSGVKEITIGFTNTDTGATFAARGGVQKSGIWFQLKNYNNFGANKVLKWDSGNEQLADSIISDDGTTVTIGGDLVVQGNQTILNTSTLEVEDDTITLRKGNNLVGFNGGIQVNRTTDSNGNVTAYQALQWYESGGYWRAWDGSVQKRLVTEDEVQVLTNKTLTSPTLSSPILGSATATTINGLTITSTASATLTLATSRTFSVQRSLSVTTENATASVNVNFRLGGDVAYKSDTLASFSSTTSTQLRGLITDTTGLDRLVFQTSPNILTSLTTTSTGFALLNSSAQSIQFGGAATLIDIGAAGGTTNINHNLVVDEDLTVGTGVADNLICNAIFDSRNADIRIRGTASDPMIVGRGGGAVGTNTALGTSALQGNNSGSQNTALGYQTLFSNNAGAGNIALGYQALRANQNGDTNIGIGRSALLLTQNGDHNVGIGANTLETNIDGNANVCIGYYAGYNCRGSGNVLIGPADSANPLNDVTYTPQNQTGDRQLVIGSGTEYWIRGDSNFNITLNNNVTVNNGLTVKGNLIVNGTTTTVKSNVVEISDKAINLAAVVSIQFTCNTTNNSPNITSISPTLGLIPGMEIQSGITPGISVPSGTTILSISGNTAVLSNPVTGTGTPTFQAIGPSDTSADDGGIIVNGTTNKTFVWKNSTDAWTSSEHFDLASGKEIRLNGTLYLSTAQIGPATGAATLGAGVLTSSLTSVGTLTAVNTSGVITSTFSTVGSSALKIPVSSASGLANNTFNVAKTVYGGLHFNTDAGTGGSARQAAITFRGNASDEAQAGIYVINNNTIGTSMTLCTTDNYTTGPQQALTISHTGAITINRSTLTVTGAINANGGINLGDGDIAYFGDGNDLEIQHTGSLNVIRTATNATGDLAIEARNGTDLYLTAADDIFIRPQGGEAGITVIGDGAVELYHNNVKKLETYASGVIVSGGRIVGADGSNFTVGIGTAHNLEFRTNDTHRLSITSTGATAPALDATYDLGTPSFRWANIYSADLQLSNEGSANEVDGTWGQYTIQEGEEDLFLINRRSGKKYKFVLQEVG